MKKTILLITALIFSLQIIAQTQIKGIVKNKTKVLSGAIIKIDGTDKSTISDMDGLFTLDCDSETAKLIITYDNESYWKTVKTKNICIIDIADYGNTMKIPDKEEDEAPIFFIVEDMPEFPGGDIGLSKFISTNIKYPKEARKQGITGKVYIRFAVSEKGKVVKAAVARGVHPLLDAEALRVVQILPDWKPGKKQGKPVSVWYTLPINFNL